MHHVAGDAPGEGYSYNSTRSPRPGASDTSSALGGFYNRKGYRDHLLYIFKAGTVEYRITVK